MTKRTCGECEHFMLFPLTGRGVLGYCRIPLPMWVVKRGEFGDPSNEFNADTDATHCETFLLKQTRKDDE